MVAERILLLYDNKTILQRMVAESETWKITILDCDPVAFLAFGSLNGVADNTVCAIQHQSSTMLTLLNQARAKYPTAGIIILTGEQITGSTRALLLLSGADACFDDDVSSVEVVAMIQSLRRRGSAFLRHAADVSALPHAVGANSLDAIADMDVEAEPSATGNWHLHNDGWSLVTPRGNSIAMTRNERHIMQKLFAQFPKVVGRQELFADSQMSERYVSLLISRMRNKSKQLGEDLPVRAVRGQGYVFLGGSQG